METDKRMSLVTRLLNADGDIHQLAEDLTRFEWDFTGQPAILNKEKLRTVLTRYINGTLSADDVHAWAEFLELRDDVDYSESGVSEILHELANPELEGKLTHDKTTKLISKLS